LRNIKIFGISCFREKVRIRGKNVLDARANNLSASAYYFSSKGWRKISAELPEN